MLPLIEGMDRQERLHRQPAKRDRIKAPKQGDTWYIRIQGGCTEVSCQLNYSTVDSEDGRGDVGAWTRQSRMRLLRKLNKIDWHQIKDNQFLTVTYPDVIDHREYSERGKDRYKLLRYLEKDQGHHVPTAWCCEWKIRQTGIWTGQLFPHFHFVAMTCKQVLKRQLREWWGKTIGYRQKNLQIDSKKIYGTDGALRYLSKYISKAEALDISAYHNNQVNFGRHWGFTRPSKIPMCPIEVCRKLSPDEIVSMRRMAVERLKFYDEEKGRSFTVLGEDSAKYWAAHLNASCQPTQGRLY